MFKEMKSAATTVKEARECKIIRKAIEDGIKRANDKAISRA